MTPLSGGGKEERQFRSNRGRNLNPMEERDGGLGEEGRLAEGKSSLSPPVLMGRRREAARGEMPGGVCTRVLLGVVRGEAVWGREGSASVFMTWLVENEDEF